MSLRWKLAALVLIVLLAACARSLAPKFVNNDDCSGVSKVRLPQTVAKLHFDTGYETEVSVEVILPATVTVPEDASTPESRIQGLMCRRELNGGAGMLFLFGEERDGAFWMYNTYLDLDIVYISPNGGIAGTRRMTSCVRGQDETDVQWSARCQAESGDYRPGAPYLATIELPAGWLASVTQDGAALSRVTWE